MNPLRPKRETRNSNRKTLNLKRASEAGGALLSGSVCVVVIMVLYVLYRQGTYQIEQVPPPFPRYMHSVFT